MLDVGDTVQVDEDVAEIETDKVAHHCVSLVSRTICCVQCISHFQLVTLVFPLM